MLVRHLKLLTSIVCIFLSIYDVNVNKDSVQNQLTKVLMIEQLKLVLLFIRLNQCYIPYLFPYDFKLMRLI